MRTFPQAVPIVLGNPLPRRADTFLAIDSTSRDPATDLGPYGFNVRGWTAGGNEYDGWQTKALPGGGQLRLPDEATARATARKVSGMGFGFFAVDQEEKGLWPPFPDIDTTPPLSATSVVDPEILAQFVTDTGNVLRWMKAEAPPLIVGSYAMPPGSYYRVIDTPEQTAWRDRDNLLLADFSVCCDVICLTAYDTSHRDRSVWLGGVNANVSRVRRLYRKRVVVYLAETELGEGTDLLPADLMTWHLLNVRRVADGAVWWGDGLWMKSPAHVKAVRDGLLSPLPPG